MNTRTPALSFFHKSTLAALCCAAAAGGWGPLNPPAGAVAPTAKPLTEVEPRTAVNAANTPGSATALFVISQPGSYYLTGNITGVSGKHGVTITANDVTLDLNGFELLGVTGSLDGVNAASNTTGIVVLNGIVRSWGDKGVDMSGIIQGGRIERITATANTGDGVTAGNAMTVRDCSSRLNGGNGISAFQSCTIVNCQSNSNTADGFNVSNGSSVIDCASVGNTGNGVRFSFNLGFVSRTVCMNNSLSGISAGNNTTVLDCTLQNNTLGGLLAGTRCVLRGNTCQGSGNGAGIHTTGPGNRIEGNTCGGFATGVLVDAAASVITRNTCTGNSTNWNIAANNICGPILDRTAPGSPAINGNSGASSLGSTDANANYTH